MAAMFFDTSDSMKIYSQIPYSFQDLLFYDGDILILTDSGSLLRISSEAPYNTIVNLGTYQSTPLALIPREGGIHVVTLSGGNINIDTLDDISLSRPADYVKPAIVSDNNGMIVNIPVYMMVPGGDQTFYFSSGTGLGKITSDTVEMILFTEQQISSLMYENSNSLLLTSGKEIYRYQIDTDNLEHVYSSSSRIIDACIAGDMILLSDRDQLTRADSTPPYNVSKVIFSFSTDAYSVCFSGSTMAVVTVEDTFSPSYRVKYFTETDF